MLKEFFLLVVGVLCVGFAALFLVCSVICLIWDYRQRARERSFLARNADRLNSTSRHENDRQKIGVC